MDDLSIAVVSAEKYRLDEIGRALQSATRRLRVTTVECAPKRLGAISEKLAADILIVDGRDDGIDALAPLEQVGIQHPGMVIVILSHCDSAEFLIQAMRLGVREVLPSHADRAALDAAIDRIAAKRRTPQAKSGKVLAFTSCKGGSGATFLATNLAYALAAQGHAQVALLDLNLQFGDAALFLSDCKITSTIADVVQGIYRLDEAFLKANMMQIHPNLGLLASPEDPTLGFQIKPEHIDALLALACRHYDYVIVDAGHHLGGLTIRALDRADTIFAVIQPSLPFARGARRMLDVFLSLEYPPQKVELVLNCFRRDSAVTVKTLEAACSVPIRRSIAHDAETAEVATNQGIPVTKLARSSPIAKSIAGWAAELLGTATVEEANWIHRMLKRA